MGWYIRLNAITINQYQILGSPAVNPKRKFKGSIKTALNPANSKLCFTWSHYHIITGRFLCLCFKLNVKYNFLPEQGTCLLPWRSSDTLTQHHTTAKKMGRDTEASPSSTENHRHLKNVLVNKSKQAARLLSFLLPSLYQNKLLTWITL